MHYILSINLPEKLNIFGFTIRQVSYNELNANQKTINGFLELPKNIGLNINSQGVFQNAIIPLCNIPLNNNLKPLINEIHSSQSQYFCNKRPYNYLKYSKQYPVYIEIESISNKRLKFNIKVNPQIYSNKNSSQPWIFSFILLSNGTIQKTIQESNYVPSVFYIKDLILQVKSIEFNINQGQLFFKHNSLRYSYLKNKNFSIPHFHLVLSNQGISQLKFIKTKFPTKNQILTEHRYLTYKDIEYKKILSIKKVHFRLHNESFNFSECKLLLKKLICTQDDSHIVKKIKIKNSITFILENMILLIQDDKFQLNSKINILIQNKLSIHLPIPSLEVLGELTLNILPNNHLSLDDKSILQFHQTAIRKWQLGNSSYLIPQKIVLGYGPKFGFFVSLGYLATFKDKINFIPQFDKSNLLLQSVYKQFKDYHYVLILAQNKIYATNFILETFIQKYFVNKVKATFINRTLKYQINKNFRIHDFSINNQSTYLINHIKNQLMLSLKDCSNLTILQNTTKCNTRVQVKLSKEYLITFRNPNIYHIKNKNSIYLKADSALLTNNKKSMKLNFNFSIPITAFNPIGFTFKAKGSINLKDITSVNYVVHNDNFFVQVSKSKIQLKFSTPYKLSYNYKSIVNLSKSLTFLNIDLVNNTAHAIGTGEGTLYNTISGFFIFEYGLNYISKYEDIKEPISYFIIKGSIDTLIKDQLSDNQVFLKGTWVSHIYFNANPIKPPIISKFNGQVISTINFGEGATFQSLPKHEVNIEHVYPFIRYKCLLVFNRNKYLIVMSFNKLQHTYRFIINKQ